MPGCPVVTVSLWRSSFVCRAPSFEPAVKDARRFWCGEYHRRFYASRIRLSKARVGLASRNFGSFESHERREFELGVVFDRLFRRVLELDEEVFLG